MQLDKIVRYRNVPFTTETPYTDFYTYGNIDDLATKCEINKEKVIKCRTVGILQSEHGKFLLSDVSTIQCEYKLQISMAYIKSLPQSTVMPYPVQVFGTLQWKNKPVIFAKLLQVLSVPMAIRIKDIMSTIAASHLAANPEDYLKEI